MPKLKADEFDIAYRAVQFRTELDALLTKHGAKLLLGWEGKWAKVQVQFEEPASDRAVTIIETAKGKRTRYTQEIEEVKT